MEIRLAGDIVFDSIVDGTGLRAVIFTQGCKHHCKNCHNPETWDFNKGIVKDTDEIVSTILKNPLNSGITFSGGDPLEQPKECLDIVLKLKSKGYNDFWAYTGYTWENIINDTEKMAFVRELNVLVDGRFDNNLKSLNLSFRGSSNQRLIDVPKSLYSKSVIVIA